MIKISPDRVFAQRKKLKMGRAEFGLIFGHSAGHQGHIETGERRLRQSAISIFLLLEREGVAAVEALKADAAPIKPHFVAALPVRPEAHPELHRLAEVAWRAIIAADIVCANAESLVCSPAAASLAFHMAEAFIARRDATSPDKMEEATAIAQDYSTAPMPHARKPTKPDQPGPSSTLPIASHNKTNPMGKASAVPMSVGCDHRESGHGT